MGRAYSYGINVWRAGPCVIVMWIYKCSRLLLVLHDVISRDIYSTYGSLTCVFTTIAHNTQRNLVMCRAGTSDLFVATINRFDVTVTECSWTLRPQTAVLDASDESQLVSPQSAAARRRLTHFLVAELRHFTYLSGGLRQEIIDK